MRLDLRSLKYEVKEGCDCDWGSADGVVSSLSLVGGWGNEEEDEKSLMELEFLMRLEFVVVVVVVFRLR